MPDISSFQGIGGHDWPTGLSSSSISPLQVLRGFGPSSSPVVSALEIAGLCLKPPSSSSNGFIGHHEKTLKDTLPVMSWHICHGSQTVSAFLIRSRGSKTDSFPLRICAQSCLDACSREIVSLHEQGLSPTVTLSTLALYRGAVYPRK